MQISEMMVFVCAGFVLIHLFFLNNKNKKVFCRKVLTPLTPNN